MVNFNKLLHPSKAFFRIIFVLFGKMTSFKFTQLLKAYSPISKSVVEAIKFNVVNELKL